MRKRESPNIPTYPGGCPGGRAKEDDSYHQEEYPIPKPLDS